MNKKLLPLLLITLINFTTVNAQTKESVKQKFTQETAANQALYNSNNPQLKGIENTKYNASTLAGITDDYIIFYTQDDIRANKASNADMLQNGEVGDISLNGENMVISIFDGGKVFNTHNEFKDLENEGSYRINDLENGAQALSSHATSVSSLIAAQGVANVNYGGGPITNAAKGILPKAFINHAGFATTVNGSVYNKILEFADPISNHSYGVNYGWSQESAQTGTRGAGFYYPVNSSSFTDPLQTYFSAYLGNDTNYDLIVSTDPNLTIVKSSGNYFGTGPSNNPNLPIYRYQSAAAGYVPFNEGEIIPADNCSTDAYCIGTGSLAKNIIVVGAVNLPSQTNDFRVTKTSDIIRSSYSSVGPRKDGAIKPDVVAVGTSVISAGSTAVNSYSAGSGTSYSAPKVTGIIGALNQLKRVLINDASYDLFADESKAYVIHSAMEAGDYDGPDNWFGWGMVDAKAAAELVLSTNNGENIYERNEKVSSTDYEKIVTAKEGEDLKVTITWIDTAARPTSNPTQDTTSKLVNDLDLRIIDLEDGTVHMPWKLDLANVSGAAVKGDNKVDNVEQVLVKNPIAGRKYKIVVSNKGQLVDYDGIEIKQNYVMIATGAGSYLSTNDLVSKNSVSIYPTVTKDVVNVKSTSKIDKIEIVDLTGRVISTSKKDVVNVSSLSSGIYIINITTNEGVTSRKFIKQ